MSTQRDLIRLRYSAKPNPKGTYALKNSTPSLEQAWPHALWNASSVFSLKMWNSGSLNPDMFFWLILPFNLFEMMDWDRFSLALWSKQNEKDLSLPTLVQLPCFSFLILKCRHFKRVNICPSRERNCVETELGTKPNSLYAYDQCSFHHIMFQHFDSMWAFNNFQLLKIIYLSLCVNHLCLIMQTTLLSMELSYFKINRDLVVQRLRILLPRQAMQVRSWLGNKDPICLITKT